MPELTQEQKVQETISAICGYEDRLLVIKNTPDEYKELFSITISPRSASIGDGISVHNPRAGETALAVRLDTLDMMRERYRKAKVMVDWFEPMWDSLSDIERELLESYKHADVRKGHLKGFARDMGYTDRHVRRLRDKALNRLVGLLF